MLKFTRVAPVSVLGTPGCWLAVLIVAVWGVSNLMAQENIRVDDQTVAVVPSPWAEFEIDTTADLRGLHVVDSNVVWASGSDGTVVYTADGGETWAVRTVVGTGDDWAGYDFRDIHAIDEATAVTINAAGSPAEILRTTNGGLRWKSVLKYPNAAASLSSISFWDDDRGLVMGNPIDGSVLLLRTTDGGASWKQLHSDNRPDMEFGETGFAGSGTNMQTLGATAVFIGLGGGKNGQFSASSRMLLSRDYCKTWTVASLPLKRSQTSGIFSVHFIDDIHGVAVGGDHKKFDATDGNYAFTSNGGKTWATTQVRVPPSGFRSCVSHYVSGAEIVLVTVGPNGTDLSTDLGHKWRRVSDKGFNVVGFSPDGKTGWAAGDGGKIAKWVKPKSADDKR